jgi:hypothetical protein
VKKIGRSQAGVPIGATAYLRSIGWASIKLLESAIRKKILPGSEKWSQNQEENLSLQRQKSRNVQIIFFQTGS